MTCSRFAAALALAAAPMVCGCLSGCGATSPVPCTTTPYISPTAATLDHTVAGNAVQFTTGTIYSGNCAQTALSIAYTWVVSDTTDASVTNLPATPGVASCTNAAAGPITVATYIAGYPAGSNLNGPPTLTPSGLPSATLTCR